MSKKNNSKSSYSKVDITNNPPAVIAIAVLTILVGIFFIVMQSDNKPISRDEAVAYTGEFERYEIWNNYRTIYLKDGSTFEVYPHTEDREFQDKMKAMDVGTKLYILVNPNNSCVIELRTDTEELINFDVEQKEIDAYDNWYIGIGIFACACGVLLIIYALASSYSKKNEQKRHEEKRKKQSVYGESKPIRYAKQSVKGKVLLETKAKGYEICYYRKKMVNELIVNGKVYDEKKALIEFEHKLFAVVDGHNIEAGLDEKNYSYIKLDGKRIAEKERLI